MKLLKLLLLKIRVTIVMQRLAMIDNRQRRTVADLVSAADYRIQAQLDFAARSQYNARCKRALLEKFDALLGSLS
ncbi:hypothetical protein [Janthinobacterium sp. MDB2-8]|uniref:hypothetical protein n=1 Tax=Janthinobacterium sp. MDB2-8 TaxID=1259338 RepID=UPI003F263648